ncbi:MAG: 3'-5' exoribonuclease, partial [Actinobacteria bacterium]|nr:3'-5' exoribonuclease [Actinomycetota bacterium]
MPGAVAVQRSFEDLGTQLIDETFVVFDLETTGGSPTASHITEIGAVKVRGGEVLGEFRTLVDPRVPIPPAITSLTGITDSMVAGWPPIEGVLPAFLEFAGDAVFVAHNASFDTGFLRAVCARLGYPLPTNRVVCTVGLARRLVRDEVPNLRLETLARAMRARHAPSHRALDDARATTDVFQALLKLAGRWGVHHT